MEQKSKASLAVEELDQLLDLTLSFASRKLRGD
eukprot:CAMPEP_0181494978 /NCGR_PEP_ID=MMETSP1110-20121109/52120_1 /TAXON_ID=174948 /ORGANISM="Symbiodinium sp., Strain CCMP421" /LENGTH=32 /DNA_ID= /DNA_START= /DNA_END= /DNA_ORIENTATION=